MVYIHFSHWWFNCHSYTDSLLELTDTEVNIMHEYTSHLPLIFFFSRRPYLSLSMYYLVWTYYIHGYVTIVPHSNFYLYPDINVVKWFITLSGCRPSLTNIEEKHSSQLLSWSLLRFNRSGVFFWLTVSCAYTKYTTLLCPSISIIRIHKVNQHTISHFVLIWRRKGAQLH